MRSNFAASSGTLRNKLRQHHEEEIKEPPQPPEPSQLELLSQKYNDPSTCRNPALAAYVAWTKHVWELAYGAYAGPFDAFIITVILMAGANVGIQTYPVYECPAPMAQTREWKDSLRDNDHGGALAFCENNGDQWLGGGGIIDTFIFWTFCTEVLIKIVAQGWGPWNYWLGPEWRWNNFDFAIVLLSIDEFSALLFGGSGGGGGNLMILRLFRLARLLKLVGKIPKLQKIVLGLIAGMKASGYIAMLLFLVFYIFAIAGMMAFQRNDPFHFRSIPVALLSLFRACTLEDWTDIMYISVYGCDQYTSGIYYTVADRAAGPSAFADSFWRDWDNLPDYFKCTHPSAQPALSVFYWVLFVFICAFVMLSLFIGAITMAMSDAAMDDDENAGEEQAHGELGLGHEVNADGSHRDEIFVDNAEEISVLFKRVWNAYALATGNVPIQYETEDDPYLLGAYSRFAALNLAVTEAPAFQNLVTLTILVAGVAVGVDSEYRADPSPRGGAGGEEGQRNAALWYLDSAVNWVFTVEVAMKLVGQDWHPWRYFYDGWNKFDFFIVFTSWLPVILGGGASNLGALKLLRLLRLFRIMRVIKKLPELTVIVDALLAALESIGFIALILFVTFYLFAVGGMILFASNDPWHFGRLHRALFTLFRISTFEDWTDVMYINLYGCKRWGYGDDDSEPNATSCRKQDFEPNAFAAFYFIAFIFLGSFTLLTLFVGVVTTSMEQARDRQRAIQHGERNMVAFFTALNAADDSSGRRHHGGGGGGGCPPSPVSVDVVSVSEDVMAAFRIVDVTEDGNVSLSEFQSAITVVTLLDEERHPPSLLKAGSRFYEDTDGRGDGTYGAAGEPPPDGDPYVFLKYILNYMARCAGSDVVIPYTDEDEDDEEGTLPSGSGRGSPKTKLQQPRPPPKRALLAQPSGGGGGGPLPAVLRAAAASPAQGSSLDGGQSADRGLDSGEDLDAAPGDDSAV